MAPVLLRAGVSLPTARARSCAAGRRILVVMREQKQQHEDGGKRRKKKKGKKEEGRQHLRAPCGRARNHQLEARRLPSSFLSRDLGMVSERRLRVA